MPERTPELRRSPAILSGYIWRPPDLSPSSPLRRNLFPLRRPKRLKPLRILLRSVSEPILSTPAITVKDGRRLTASLRLARPHTCTNETSPSRWPKSPSSSMGESMEETKVVVSVAVEGSPGPVMVMVRLGASVEEIIATVVDKYGREGRSPQLDRKSADSFELHHSHFCLQSLRKSDKIGELGGRSFYLRTKSHSHSFNSGREASDIDLSADVNEVHQATESHNSSVITSQLFFSSIVNNFNKIERRTKKICRMMACFLCV